MNVQFKKSFLKDLDKLKDKRIKEAIYKAIVNVEQASSLIQIKNLKPLTGFDSHYPIRIGDYRIGIKIEEETIYFAAFRHRKEIYKIFP